MAEVRVLGSLELLIGDRPIRLNQRTATVLALLAGRADQTIGRDHLIDAVWQEDPPASAAAQITMIISTLRKSLPEPEAIHTNQFGYRLDPALVRVDLRTAEELIDRARKEDGTPDLYRQAFALWRGSALPGLPGAAIAQLAERLNDLRLTILEEWAGVQPEPDASLVGELARAVVEHPLREPLRARLMEQLWLGGKQAEALAHYREARKLLREELGIDPGPDLRDLHDRILRGETPSATGSAPGLPPHLSQLPPPISAFIGRGPALEQLNRMMLEREQHLPIAMISGPAGVGKTTLAVHWAHQALHRFPGGQLYADLRGYDPLAEPATADEILERFLPALGVPSGRIPADHQERAALYRSMLQGRNALVLLDNAVSTTQVRSLLPGHPGCAVVVTTRNRLDDLVTRSGARPIEIDAFDPTESTELLTRVIGSDRVAGEPDAADRLSQLCGGLPLALRIAAARVEARPTWTLRRLVDRMTDERARLDQLSGEDGGVRGTFDISYRHLPARAATAFRRLGLVLAPAGLAAWTLAALLDDPDLTAAEAMLEELADAHLLQALSIDGAGQSRFRMHDLVRLFARERAEADESPADVSAAIGRVQGALLGLTELAGRGFRGTTGGLEEAHGDFPRWLPDRWPDLLDDPLEWLDAERLTITSAVRQAAADQSGELCWDLVASSSILHRRRGYLDDQQTKYALALDLCRSTGDRRGEAALLLMHNDLHVRRGEVTAAAAATSRAASLFGRIGDPRAEALARAEYAIVQRVLGDWNAALAACQAAAAYFAAAGDAASTAYVEHILGTVHLGRNDPEAALLAAERGLAVVPDGAREVALYLRLLLAEAQLRSGRPDAAMAVLETLVGSARRRSDRRMEVQALLLQGDGQIASGRRTAGLALLHDAVELARQLGDRLLEGRGLLATGRADPARYVGRLRAAVSIFADQDHRVWHAEALTALEAAVTEP